MLKNLTPSAEADGIFLETGAGSEAENRLIFGREAVHRGDYYKEFLRLRCSLQPGISWTGESRRKTLCEAVMALLLLLKNAVCVSLPFFVQCGGCLGLVSPALIETTD
jgi:monomeric isocitrate dehydrogenase